MSETEPAVEANNEEKPVETPLVTNGDAADVVEEPANDDPFAALSANVKEPDLMNLGETATEAPGRNGDDSTPIAAVADSTGDMQPTSTSEGIEANGGTSLQPANEDETEDALQDLAPQEDPFGAFDSINDLQAEAPAFANTNNLPVVTDDPFSAFDGMKPDVLNANDFDANSTEENGVHEKEAAAMSMDGLSNGGDGSAPVIEPSADEKVDDFGGINAVAPEVTSPALEETVAATISSDDFGDFNAVAVEAVAPTMEEAAPMMEEAAPMMEEAAPPTDESDDFGDFNAVTPKAIDPATEEKAATTDASDAVGDFNAAASETTDPAMEETAASTDESDDFGDFDAVAPETTDQDLSTKEGISATADESDDFGDFNAVASETTEQDLPAKEETPIAAVETDNFGDFSVVASEKSAPMMEETTPAVDKSDGFGEFKTVASESTEQELPEKDEAAAVLEPIAAQDDDFGDFAESAQTEQPAAEELISEPAQDDDDFGDFTSQNVEPVQDLAATDATDDDDFGDFGGFTDPTQSAEPTQPGLAEATKKTLEVDDFGNFSDAPNGEASAVQPISTPATLDDDDFGDFGDFNDAPKSSEPKPQPVQAAQDDDDDFGDFGDFNDAPQSTESSANGPAASAAQEDHDDFGDFGDFGATPDTIPVVSQPQLVLNDPFVGRAKAVFAAVFGNDNQNDEKEDIEAGANDMALGDILAEILSEAKEPESLAANRAKEKLGSLLGSIEMCEKSSPSVILDRKAVQPYSHYSSPAVVPAPALQTGERKSKRRSASESGASVADNVELSTSIDEAETLDEPIQEVDNGGEAEATIVEIPPTDVKLDFTDFKAPIEKDDSGTANEARKKPTSAAKLFLQQIPDLSFMLSSTLSLPKK